jgi:hypothetical protein
MFVIKKHKEHRIIFIFISRIFMKLGARVSSGFVVSCDALLTCTLCLMNLALSRLLQQQEVSDHFQAKKIA